MYIPFLTSKATSQTLSRRKGGGGRGGGGRGGGGGGGKSGGSSGKGGGSSGGSGTRKSPVSTSKGSKPASSYGGGGGAAAAIPAGQLFAGRLAGGGTRNDIFGTRTYGSGYPGVAGRGVSGRGFPFFFWPLAWGGVAGAGTEEYLHNKEYGAFDNSSRPGGIMTTAAFQSSSNNSIFRILADNTTVSDLIEDIRQNCSSSLSSTSSTSPSSYNASAPDAPKPEQVIQYYRASSVALSLDGYNNTAALQAEGTPDVPLPNNIDTTLMDCLNQTIGLAVPLIDGAGVRWSAPHLGILGFIWVIWSISTIF